MIEEKGEKGASPDQGWRWSEIGYLINIKSLVWKSWETHWKNGQYSCPRQQLFNLQTKIFDEQHTSQNLDPNLDPKPTWTSMSEERREVKIQEYLDAASGSPDSRSTRTWRKMIKNPPKTGFKQLLRKNLQVAPMDVGDDRIHLMLFGHLDD